MTESPQAKREAARSRLAAAEAAYVVADAECEAVHLARKVAQDKRVAAYARWVAAEADCATADAEWVARHPDL